ncbi:phosphoribosyltransferase family protein [Flexivirga meconopsidis]|uniref:phosphoribosyltransferase family protein n=1 Tax=Flexivirga meconopsidis TaxID=2977121 RepID=UPI00223F7AFE|nr:phosphoribosyltransferase family protein [Flexivirga meconopsidis]
MSGPTTRVVAHPLTGTADRPVDGRTGENFDTATYSLMKHGDVPSIRALGEELAATLLEQCPWLRTDPRPIVLPVAYLVAPPACYHLAAVVGEHLDARRPDLPAARIVHVHKDSVTHIDYAASSADDRRKDLQSIGFRLTESIDDAIAIVVDDIRVTGLAEEVILGTLKGAGAARLIAAYVADCDVTLATDPSIESALNHARVRSITDMLPSIERGEFVVTIRFLKRLLGDPQAAQFLAHCPPELIAQFRDYAYATGPEFLAGYPRGTAALDAASDHGHTGGERVSANEGGLSCRTIARDASG